MAGTGRMMAVPAERLTDRVAIGVLVSLVPVSLLDEVLRISGCADRRRRALPARLVIYYVLALCLLADHNYDQVMRILLDGLSWRSRGSRSWERAPSASAISRARARLGSDPLRVLFERMAGPLGEPDAPVARYRGLRLLSLDGTALDVPESEENSAFGYPGDAARFPQVRVFAVAEEGGHALVDATFGSSAVAERVLAGRLLRCLRPGTLLAAPARAWSPDLVRRAARTGADLILELPGPPAASGPAGLSGLSGPLAGDVLADGTRLCEIAGVPFRVVPTLGLGALATTLTDPVRAPAAELAARYAGRWTFDDALTWMRPGWHGRGTVLRSRNPDMVVQEIWALLCVYQAMRALTCQAGPSRWCACRRAEFAAAESPTKRLSQ
ncbi:transposase domain-containing protein [Actinomadura viridis]|uniref:transposase domain-containing protein n=1 Tax=Actinomadura viridis TaxID=58110 RepID=UPI0036BC84C8